MALPSREPLQSGQPIVCYNGEFLPVEQTSISPTDSGFTHGYGVFTTARVEAGQLLHASAHFRRLAEGARTLRIPFRQDPDEFQILCEQVVDANQLKEARLRVTLTRGPGRDTIPHSREGEETFLITVTALRQNPLEMAKPKRLTWASFPKNHESPLARVKNCNYTESLMMLAEVRELGFDDAVFINTNGYLAECCIANLFWVIGDDVFTPSVESGALPGVMRHIIIETCMENGINCIEGEYDLDDLSSVQEIFTTNAVQQISPVSELEDLRIELPPPGPLTEFLFHRYREKVELEINRRRN